MPYIAIALIISAITVIILGYKPITKTLSKRRANRVLENFIFNNNTLKKKETLDSIHNITKHRFSDEAILDYFYKTKGYQIISTGQNINFWVKIYLSSPTKIKLSYFEQVNFYKLFLNQTAIIQQDSKARFKKALITRKRKKEKMATFIA